MLAAVAAALVIVHGIFGTTCLFKGVTGYPCPGCGMTRACYSALTGHFKDAFSLHPLFPLAPVMIAAVIVYTYIKKPLLRKIAEISLLAMGAAFIIVWIIRLAIGWR